MTAPAQRCAACGRTEGHPIHDEEYERGGHDFTAPAPAETKPIVADLKRFAAELRERGMFDHADQATYTKAAPAAEGAGMTCSNCGADEGKGESHAYGCQNGEVLSLRADRDSLVKKAMNLAAQLAMLHPNEFGSSEFVRRDQVLAIQRDLLAAAVRK